MACGARVVSRRVVAVARLGDGLLVLEEDGRWRLPSAPCREDTARTAARVCAALLGVRTGPSRCACLLEDGDETVVVRSARVERWLHRVHGVRAVNCVELDRAVRDGRVSDVPTLAAWMRMRDLFA